MLSARDFERRLHQLQEHFNATPPELEVTVRDPAYGVEGYVVVWNTAISRSGPLPNCAKGGTRLRDGLSLQEVKMLACTMALKNAAAALPIGGAKSGMNAEPRAELFEKKYRRFVEMCKPFLYENDGIFGGFGFDMGGAPEQAIWACDTLGSYRSFTGKPVTMGGTDYDREGIAGLGVAEAAARLVELHNEKVPSLRFAVHGVGAMGAAVLRYFAAKKAHLCAIGDPKYGGSWRFTQEISKELVTALGMQKVGEARELLGQEGQFVGSNPNQVLSEPCDVLFPCAQHKAITAENAPQVHARYLVEGANNPCAAESIPILHDKKINVVPDFIANAGGIIAATVELIAHYIPQNTTDLILRAKNMTRTRIHNNMDRLLADAQRFNVSLRKAALSLALRRIAGEEPLSEEERQL